LEIVPLVDEREEIVDEVTKREEILALVDSSEEIDAVEITPLVKEEEVAKRFPTVSFVAFNEVVVREEIVPEDVVSCVILPLVETSVGIVERSITASEILPEVTRRFNEVRLVDERE